MKKIIALSLVTGSLLLAQKVTQVKFDGLVHLSPSVAKEVADINVGDDLNPLKINNSVKKLFAQGYFKDVYVENRGGGRLVYHVKEKSAITNIKVEGYGNGDDAVKTLATLGLKRGDFYNKRTIEKAKKALIKRIEAEGYYDTVVEVKETPISDGVALTFNVNKGEKINIKKVNFTGNKALSSSDISKKLVNKESEALGWLPWRNAGNANVGQLSYDAYRARDAYLEKGYLDATVSKPIMKVDFGTYDAEVNYVINEGVQYKVSSVTVANNVRGLKINRDELKLKKGRVFNISKMRKDIKYIQEEVGNLGYANAQISPTFEKNTEQKKVRVVYQIHTGEKVKINDVIISGNSTTKDSVVRRYVYLAPGDTYSSRDLKDSKSALGRTGFFEKVEIVPERVSADKINLHVKVKETATGSITAGGGYGSYEGFMLNASVSDKNIFGSGINASLGFDVSEVSTNYNLSFRNPRVFDSEYSVGFSLYKRDYDYVDYTQKQLGGSVAVGKQFTRSFYASLGYAYTDTDFNQANNTLSQNGSANTASIFTGTYIKSSALLGFKFDNTDDYYTPREGFLAGLNIEFAGLGGDAEFTKYKGKFGVYYGFDDIIDYDLILRYKARLSVITDNGYVPLAEKLFMGGIGSIRGYNAYSLSPRDAENRRTGGLKSFSTSIEASIPLSESAKMRLTGFYDFGMIGQDTFDEIKRSSAGIVIEWQSGFGPINLVFAKALDDEIGDSTSTFEFSMGSKF
ncbi:Outer membrane protein assembly factor YaeT precursor [hydrothermal vent metagenome]|uniref:Outer membrane protein assembly factor YaeT n=1 Tax=hydrothermal vent metagenome TaxID=652676 RepID=A0A1W1EJL9_9ZZZZ